MATKKFKSLPKKAKKAAFAEMDKDGTRRTKKNEIAVKKLHDAGKNFNPKTKTVTGLPSLPKPTTSQLNRRISSLNKIAGQSKGAAALLRSLKKK